MKKSSKYHVYSMNVMQQKSGEFVVIDEFPAYLAKDIYSEEELFDAFKTFKLKSMTLPVGTRIKYYSPKCLLKKSMEMVGSHMNKEEIEETLNRLEKETNWYNVTDDVVKVQFSSCNNDSPYLFVAKNDILKRTVPKEVLDWIIYVKKEKLFAYDEVCILRMDKSELGISCDLSGRFTDYIYTRLLFLFNNGTDSWLSKNEKEIIELVTKTSMYIQYHKQPNKMIDITASILERYCENMKYGHGNIRERIPHYDIRDLLMKAIEEKNDKIQKELSYEQTMEMEANNHMKLLENSWSNIVRNILM